MAVHKQQIWRVVDLLLWTKNYLRERGSDAPQIEAELLLREVLQCSRLEIYLRHEQPLTTAELAQFKRLLLKRAAGQPIQYVLGKTEFMGLEIEVNPAVLIPRPETELLVEQVLKHLPTYDKTEVKILDIGTGSGCIALALAYHKPVCQVLGIDISDAALQVAQRNAHRLGLEKRVTFQQVDILNSTPLADERFDIVVSNPPYVGGEGVGRLPAMVREHEPAIALFPGEDELLFYRRIAAIAPQILVSNGWVALEIGGSYMEQAVRELLLAQKFATVEVYKDYSGQSRVVIGSWSG